MKQISNKMKEEWLKEGWSYKETEHGFYFSINFPFGQLTRTITISFESEPRNYYFIETILTNGNDYITENLFVEMKEHMLIHNTLIDLGWITTEIKTEECNEERNLFNL